MAHEFETGFFVSEPAWHGLGTILDKPPTVKDAIKCANLDWTVSLNDLQMVADGRPVTHKAVVRDSDQSILGVVGPEFTPVQNSEAFDWFNPFVESGAVTLEAAGSLREGRRIWVLAKIADLNAEILPGDSVERYLTLAHGHDGSLAIRVGFTDTRIVCANTLSVAISSGGGKLLKLRHTKNVHDSLKIVQDIIDIQRKDFAATMDQMRTLVRYGCDETKMRRYVREVFEPGHADDEKAAKTLQNKILPLFEVGRGSSVAGVRGTMWGAANAILEYLTHERGKSASNRVDSMWFGPTGAEVARTWEVGLQLCA